MAFNGKILNERNSFGTWSVNRKAEPNLEQRKADAKEDLSLNYTGIPEDKLKQINSTFDSSGDTIWPGYNAVWSEHYSCDGNVWWL